MSHLVPPITSNQPESLPFRTPVVGTPAVESRSESRSEKEAEPLRRVDMATGSGLESIARHPLVVASSYFQFKPWIDRLVTCLLLVPAAPLMLLIAAAILVFDGRPVLFRQRRVGKNGQLFMIFKFRSMYRDAEGKTGPVWSTDQDPRVTPLGRWLRRSHMDELPQLLNVVRGEMNLIGPRPERPEFVEELAEQLPRYRERLTVRPGITGLAQLRLGYDRCVSDVAHKVETDLTYIRTASMASDGKLLLSTLPYIAGKVLRAPEREPSTLEAEPMHFTTPDD